MQIQIQLTQADIEAAIRDYLVKVGMTSPVDTINFAVSRKGGQTIDANIDLTPEGTVQGETSIPEGPIKRTPQAETPWEPEPEPETPARPEPKTKTKPASKQAKVADSTPEPQPEPEAEDPQAGYKALEKEQEANKDIAPANDSTEAEPTASESKRLFG